MTFAGFFSPVSLDANDKSVLYLGAGNKLYYPSKAMTVNACRAVFALNGLTADEPNDQTTNSQTTNPVRAFHLDFGDGDGSAGVSPATVADGDVRAPGWHTLDGRRINGQPTRNGVYVVNGKKRVIK